VRSPAYFPLAFGRKYDYYIASSNASAHYQRGTGTKKMRLVTGSKGRYTPPIFSLAFGEKFIRMKTNQAQMLDETTRG
jgi:hypothetical protein